MEPFRVVMVGAGGIGSWLAKPLCAMLEYKAPGSGLVIVDGDYFEPKNKERQNFSRLGNKAEVLAADLAGEYQRTVVIPQAMWVVSDELADVPDEDGEDDDTPKAGKIGASSLLMEGDIVIPVVDNHASRKIIFEAATKLDCVDVMTGGNDDELYLSTYHYCRRDGQDVTASPVDARHPELFDPPDRNPGELSCQERAEIEGGTQLIATNFAVGAYILGKIQHVIFDEADPLPSTEIYVELGMGQADAFDREPEQVPVNVA